MKRISIFLKTLFSVLKDEFKRAYGVFQQNGLAVAANYSILNFQSPNHEWKKARVSNLIRLGYYWIFTK